MLRASAYRGKRCGKVGAHCLQAYILPRRGVVSHIPDAFCVRGMLSSMSSQTDWMVGCFLSAQWKLQYATLMVVMQILHYPMALWYLGARSYCVLQSSSARSLCVKVLSLPVHDSAVSAAFHELIGFQRTTDAFA